MTVRKFISYQAVCQEKGVARETVATLFLCLLLVSLVISPSAFAQSSFTVGLSRIHVNTKNYKELRDEHVVKQSIDYSCGPACMATILTSYLGKPVTEAQIIEHFIMNLTDEDWAKIEERQGFSLLDLKRYAVENGYRAAGYRLDVESLLLLKKPVLIPIRVRGYDHFVVFRGYRGNRVFLADPSMGNQRMLISQFRHIWKGGIGMVIDRGEGQPAEESHLLQVSDAELLESHEQVNLFITQQVISRPTHTGEF